MGSPRGVLLQLLWASQGAEVTITEHIVTASGSGRAIRAAPQAPPTRH